MSNMVTEDSEEMFNKGIEMGIDGFKMAAKAFCKAEKNDRSWIEKVDSAMASMFRKIDSGMVLPEIMRLPPRLQGPVSKLGRKDQEHIIALKPIPVVFGNSPEDTRMMPIQAIRGKLMRQVMSDHIHTPVEQVAICREITLENSTVEATAQIKALKGGRVQIAGEVFVVRDLLSELAKML